MNESKANKNETENMLDAISTLNRQVQHAVVILNEALQLNLVMGEETRLAKEDRALNLIKQAQALSNWVIQTDLESKICPNHRDTVQEVELLNAKKALKLAMKDNQEVL